MNKTEARKIAMKARRSQLASDKKIFAKDIKFVEGEIKKAARDGFFYVDISLDDVNEESMDAIEDVFTRRGYTVRNGFYVRRSGIFSVSWDE